MILGKSGGISLKDHVSDIIKVFNRLRDNVKNNAIEKCVELAIKFHDLGKVMPYFQIKVLKNSEYEPFNLSKELNIYHSIASLLFVNKQKLGELLGENRELMPYVLSAIAYHHWKSSLEEDMEASEKYRRLKESNLGNMLVQNLRKELGDLLTDDEKALIDLDSYMLEGLANGLNVSEYALPPYRMEWLPVRKGVDDESTKKWILISGFLIRCDHYASYCEMTTEDWNSKSEQDKEKILRMVEIENIKYSEICSRIEKEIQKKIQPDKKEAKLWQKEELQKTTQENLILIAPTGSGKTEFAFLWGKGEKLIYTLPIRAIVEQTYDRAKEIFGEDRVGLLHGDADIYLLGDDEAQEKLRVYELSKELCFPVIVSTGDQFFPYALRPPGYERIYATLSYSRLVIDEVQAYDPVACAIVVKFIEDILRLGGKFLLITATLPNFVEEELKKRLGEEKFQVINMYERNEKYSALKKHIFSLREESWSKKQEGSGGKDIIQEAIDKAEKEKKKVLIILNTISKAEEIEKEIISRIDKSNLGIKLVLLHSEMTANEKKKRKEDIINLLKEDKGSIVVSTQVIEAGMDIDADILYTELCPMDVLVQRMGRILRRYKEDYDIQKSGNPEPNVIVVKNPAENAHSGEKSEKDVAYYESGRGHVYKKELLEITLKILKENAEESKIILSESDKHDLVRELYRSIDPRGKYLEDFYKTLDVLDVGYMSDKRVEAQEVFRRINNVSTVSPSKLDDLQKKLCDLLEQNSSLKYLDFKKEVIAQYIVQKQAYKVKKQRKKELSAYLESVLESCSAKREEKEKIIEWSKGIFIVWEEEEEARKYPFLENNII